MTYHLIFTTHFGHAAVLFRQKPFALIKTFLPRAYRFVVTTLANNPFPILIPCHRVIRSDSSFGQFGGGTDLKRKMIELEAE